MFVVNFSGGIGNQMFQYALYKAMEKKYPNSSVKMLDSCFGHNGFELDRVFHIKKNECTLREAAYLGEFIQKEIRYKKIINGLNHLRRIIFGNKQSYIFQDNPAAFYKEIFQLNPLKSYLLDGFWQNIKYFEDISEQLTDAFHFKVALKGKNLEFQEKMMSTNSVSIHVRRGDYIKVGFPVLSMDYYRDAINMFEEQIENPLYFIFSDDSNFIRDNFGFLSNYIVVDCNSGNDSYIDMQLMSTCKHNIIANSTFSFWGAFLNDYPKKIVVSPNKIRKEHKDSFVSKDWVQLDIEKYSLYVK